MVNRCLLIVLLISPVTLFAESEDNGITAERLRLVASDAEREKRLRASRVDPTNMNSFLDHLYSAEKKGDALNTIIPEEERKSRAEGIFNYNKSGVSSQSSNKQLNENNAQGALTSESLPDFKQSNINKTNKTGKSNTGAVRSSKYSNNAEFMDQTIQHQVTHKNTKTIKIIQPQYNEFVYVAPARSAGGGNGASNNSDAGVVAKRKFGIRIGTWMKGRLNRSTTNSDPGLVEVHITEEIQGDRRSLPAGTIVFCQKRFNRGTRRLDMEILRALLPSGEEVELTALIYDEQRTAGLRGIVVENENRSVTSGLVDGVLTAGGKIASLGANSSAGIIIDSTINSVSGDQRQINKAKNPTIAYTIHVPAQTVLVQIQTTF